MKILVTGAMGFIGSNLVPTLLNANCDVIGFDNLFNQSIEPTTRMKKEAGINWNKFKFFYGDVSDFDHVYSIMSAEQPTHIVHLAALGSVTRSFKDPAGVAEVNITGFCNVLTAASKCGVKRVVYASSSSVYGNHPDGIRKEENLGFPLSPYALSKLHNEMFAQQWHSRFGLELIGLRFFNVYGPGQRHDSEYSAVIPKFITEETITINGDGDTVRDFTYVTDAVAAITKALMCEAKFVVCNIGTGVGTSLNELVELVVPTKLVEHEDGSKPHEELIKPVEYGPARPGDIKESIASIEFADKMIGHVSTTPIRDGIKRTMEFYEGLKG